MEDERLEIRDSKFKIQNSRFKIRAEPKGCFEIELDQYFVG
jgi:hypothetical protein